MKTASLSITFSILSATLLISGCSAGGDDLEQWKAEQSKGMAGQVQPLPPITPYTPLAYIGRDLNDPFAPKKAANKNASAAPDASRKKEFLESYPLDRLVLVGAIKRNGKQWGLIKTPDGTINMVKVGDYLGQNFGKITTVKDAELTLKESVLDPQGDWIEREVNLNITRQ